MKIVFAALLGLAACTTADDSPDTDAPLPSCTGLCQPVAFCTADGVCTCTVDGNRVTCQRQPAADGGLDGG